MTRDQKQKQVRFVRPSLDCPPWKPQVEEHEFIFEKSEYTGRPAVIVSGLTQILERRIVLPLNEPDDPNAKRAFGVDTEAGDHGKIRKGWVLCDQPFGFHKSAIGPQKDCLSGKFTEILSKFNSYLETPDGNFKRGQIVKIAFSRVSWGVIASAPRSPLGLISVFPCLEQYLPFDEESPAHFILEKGVNWKLDDAKTSAPDGVPEKLTVSLMQVRTITHKRIMSVFGELFDNSVVSAKLSSLLITEE